MWRLPIVPRVPFWSRTKQCALGRNASQWPGCRQDGGVSGGMNWGWEGNSGKEIKCTACGLHPSPNLILSTAMRWDFVCSCELSAGVTHTLKTKKKYQTQGHKMNFHKRDTPGTWPRNRILARSESPSHAPQQSPPVTPNTQRAC